MFQKFTEFVDGRLPKEVIEPKSQIVPSIVVDKLPSLQVESRLFSYSEKTVVIFNSPAKNLCNLFLKSVGFWWT